MQTPKREARRRTDLPWHFWQPGADHSDKVAVFPTSLPENERRYPPDVRRSAGCKPLQESCTALRRSLDATNTCVRRRRVDAHAHAHCSEARTRVVALAYAFGARPWPLGRWRASSRRAANWTRDARSGTVRRAGSGAGVTGRKSSTEQAPAVRAGLGAPEQRSSIQAAS